MIYSTTPRYMLVVATGTDPDTQSVHYFGRRPSVQDFIKHNCRSRTIELYERDTEGAYQPVYEASIDENGKATNYSGRELKRKGDVA